MLVLFEFVVIFESVIAGNMRTGSKAGQCSLFESSDSNDWCVCFATESADSAACAGHYAVNFRRIYERNI
jgi:hypothetical protein